MQTLVILNLAQKSFIEFDDGARGCGTHVFELDASDGKINFQCGNDEMSIMNERQKKRKQWMNFNDCKRKLKRTQ